MYNFARKKQSQRTDVRTGEIRTGDEMKFGLFIYTDMRSEASPTSFVQGRTPDSDDS